MKKNILLIMLVMLGSLCCLAQDEPTIIINEIQVCNNDLLVDPSYNYGGWIELYNTTDEDISLTGKYITDDESNPKKFQLTSSMGKVPANGFLVLWFDHNKSDGNYGGKSANQIRFKLNAEGGKLFLFNKDGSKICDAAYPAGIPRCSYALSHDGAHYWGWTATPTPGASNNNSVFASKRLEAPVISIDGRLLEEDEAYHFTVTIPEGATLVYTTDGSTPTLTRGEQSIDTETCLSGSQTCIYRFAAFRDGYLPSPVVTRSFIYKNHDYYLPVISIATQHENLFGDTLGIYCVGKNGISGRGISSPRNWNMDWERPVNVELLVPEKNEEGKTSFISYINQEVDMEICGGWSRGYGGNTTDGKTWDAKPSFRLKCDKKYEGVNVLDYPIFPHRPYNKYKVWQVRNGGNDTQARIKDAAIAQTVIRSDFNLDAQDCRPAHVFMNGQYLGMMNIRESNNRHYGYSAWGIDTDDMDQFELSGGLHQMVGTSEVWNKIITLGKQLSSDKSQATYQELCTLLDVDEFVNYMAMAIYMSPSDWLNNVNNTKAYRARSDGGKYRFILFDMDSAFESDGMIDKMMNSNYGSNIDDLFRYLMAYEPFRQRFVNVYCMIDGSVFEPTRCQEIVDEMYDERNTALGFEGNSSSKNIYNLINKAHGGSPIKNLQSVLGLSSPYYLQISSNISEAHLVVDEQIIPTRKFEGYLYPLSSQLQLTSQAPAAYRFMGWKASCITSPTPTKTEDIIPLQSEWDYYDQGSLDGITWSASDYASEASGWKQGKAPLGFGSSGSNFSKLSNTTLDFGNDTNNKRTTYYFRHNFYLDHAPQENEVFKLEYQVDDGFRFYVNGKDIGGFRLDAGCVYATFTSTYTGSEADKGAMEIRPEDLHEGMNTLAVEVHNNSLTSSDIFWEGRLVRETHEEKTVNDSLIVSETFNLVATLPVGGYQLEAQYERIQDQMALQTDGITPVRINEVSAGNDIHINDWGKKNDWIELYNTTDQDIDLAGMYLSDKKKNPTKWQITSGNNGEGADNRSTVIPAHGTLIVWCDQLQSISQLHAPFKLDNSDGSCVSIQAQDGRWYDRMEYMEQPRWQTYGRFPDGANFTTLMTWPTIHHSNLLPSYSYAQSLPSLWDDGSIHITLELAKGWNWTSHNLASDVHTSRFTAHTTVFLGEKDRFWLNDSTQTWIGELEELKKGKGYKLLCGTDNEVILRGLPYDPTTSSITLHEGWNWIGFPLYNATSLHVALSQLDAAEGDFIVGMDQFATFEDGEWEGTLESLQPGQAYLYKSQQENVFKWTAMTQPSSAPRRYAAARPQDDVLWAYDVHAYPHVQSIVATIDASTLDSGTPMAVGFFAGDECRGLGRWEDEHMYINIHGEDSEPLTLRLLDAEGNIFDASTPFTFHPLTTLGTPSEPYILKFQNNDIVDVIPTIYNAGQVISRSYYNLQGQRINRPQGLCIEISQMADGRKISKKIKQH